MPQTRKLLAEFEGPPQALESQTPLSLPVHGRSFRVLTRPLRRGQWHMDIPSTGGETQEWDP